MLVAPGVISRIAVAFAPAWCTGSRAIRGRF
jgi:hypothetical protein